MRHWWETDEWAKHPPMEFSRRDRGPVVSVTDDTDPELYRTPQGSLRLRLVPARRSKVRIFTGGTAWLGKTR